jgi:hypothetical protein
MLAGMPALYFLIPSSLFFSFPREKKRKKRITMTMTDQTPGQAGDLVRYCRRPGCGAPVQQAGHGRPRQYCSDACTSAYHNASRAGRARSTDAGNVTAEADGLLTGPDGDPLAGLDAVLRQAAALARHARAEAARLDPAQVRAQLADADAGRRRAEAAAVVAHAQAAEADQELQAALEALEGARRLQQDAQARADRAQAEAAAARADAATAITASRAETGACQQQARQAADDAAAIRGHAETEITRARQAETDARAETGRSRADAARERDTLHAAHAAQLQACRQLADLHRDRAERAETALDAARAKQRHPAADTAAAEAGGGQQPAPRRARTSRPAST